jgi:hypothetical protein
MFFRRFATLGTLAALVGSAGCLWRPKPYAADPLVRGRRATLTNPAIAPTAPEPPAPPTPPLPTEERPPDPNPGR